MLGIPNASLACFSAMDHPHAPCAVLFNSARAYFGSLSMRLQSFFCSLFFLFFLLLLRLQGQLEHIVIGLPELFEQAQFAAQIEAEATELQVGGCGGRRVGGRVRWRWRGCVGGGGAAAGDMGGSFWCFFGDEGVRVTGSQR